MSDGPLIGARESTTTNRGFELSAAEREAIEHEKHHYEDPRAASIEALENRSGSSVVGCRTARSTLLPMCWYSGERRRRRRHILQPDLPSAGRSPRDSLRGQRGVPYHRAIRFRPRLENLNIKPGQTTLMVALRCCRPVARELRG